VVDVLDQVSVIHHGKDILHGGAEQLISREDDLNTIGLRVPLVAHIAGNLRRKGWPLAEDIASLPKLEYELKDILREDQ